MTAIDALVNMYAEQFVRRFEHIEGHWSEPIVDSSEHPHQNIAGNAYRGCNRAFLPIMASQHKFRLPLWMTVPQMNDLGVYVKRGQSGFPVSFTDIYIKNLKTGTKSNVSVEDFDKMSIAQRESEGLEKMFRTKWYKVFNIEQTNFAEVFPNSMEELHRLFGASDGQAVRSELLDKMVSEDAWLCPIIVDGKKAAYDMDSDSITIPDKSAFVDDKTYYNTLVRCMAESTGSEMRLDRGIWSDIQGDKAKEALVCQLSAASMGALLGIGYTLDDSDIKYFKKWIEEAKVNPEFIYGAVQEASRATECLGNALGLNIVNGVNVTEVIAKQYSEVAEKAAKKKEVRVLRHENNTVKIQRQNKPRTGRRL